MIIHICKHHGPLEPDNFIKKGKNSSGSQAYRCKFCMKDTHKKLYAKNKEKINERNKLYREKNKEKVKEMRLEYYHATKELDLKNKRKRDKKFNQKQRDDLSDRYIKSLLTKHNKFKSKDLTPFLIESKRNDLIDKRQKRNKGEEDEPINETTEW